MRRVLLALGLIAMPAFAAQAGGPPPGPTCAVTDTLLTRQDPNTVTIGCRNVSAEFAARLADVLNAVLKRKLDPQLVVARLADLAPAGDGVARNFTLAQRQSVVTALSGKPAAQVAIVADPTESDAPGYATSIATALQMVGWQVAGNQIARKMLPGLATVRGVAVAVHDAGTPPANALALKAALQAANVETPIRSDPTLSAGETVLWIGKRPSFNPGGPKS